MGYRLQPAYTQLIFRTELATTLQFDRHPGLVSGIFIDTSDSFFGFYRCCLNRWRLVLQCILMGEVALRLKTKFNIHFRRICGNWNWKKKKEKKK
ncbi:hypothetical protein LAZ67_4002667 [Cordylochernes scorpioides]|uniref:Uncharacterized protein n=1 Tax=Cordylochernes scorpioides TaxID=51811 RepID=A0ABY6KHP6_9ARAC|nr:hypothetical protein LAZ67_4002667 [Cordylochernes scorpioides]